MIIRNAEKYISKDSMDFISSMEDMEDIKTYLITLGFEITKCTSTEGLGRYSSISLAKGEVVCEITWWSSNCQVVIEFDELEELKRKGWI